jgi:hypothetical protein
MSLIDNERVRKYLEESSVLRSLGENSGRLLRLLVEKTLEGAPPKAMTIAGLRYGVAVPSVEQETQIRDGIARLRKALSFYYAQEGANDSVVLRIPNNVKRQGYTVEWTFFNRSEPVCSASDLSTTTTDRPWTTTLSRSGLANAFRIKQQNSERLLRVRRLIQEESGLKHPHFRLAASSGFSYLNRSMGPVWVEAGLGEAVYNRKARFDVVLESPFSDFAECRALANADFRHHWDRKVDLQALETLEAERPNVAIRVTEIPVNCSLFLTSTSVFYDPYLWARPSRVHPTENNFWVLEFCRGEEDYDCYELLTRHFAFVWENSVTLREFLRQEPSYQHRTKLFEQRAKTRLRQTKTKGRRA